MIEPLAFLSYRREDAPEAAQAIYTQMKVHFGSGQLFMDVNSMVAGDEWSQRILGKVKQATGMLVVIGENWLTITDEWERRRIDRPDDWVYREIRAALARPIRVIPVLIGKDTKAIPPDVLPAGLRGLFKRNYHRLETSGAWERQMNALANVCKKEFRLVEDHALRDVVPASRDPKKAKRRSVRPKILTAFLKRSDDWEPWTDTLPREYPYSRQELRKNFVFDAFEDAMDFMNQVSHRFGQAKHHPRWSNENRLVTIRLSTWDAGNKITTVDLRVAKIVDDFYKQFLARKKVRKKTRPEPSHR